MSILIDRVGAFRGKPVEWSMSSNRNSGYPCFNIRAKATQFYAETPEDMKAFDVTEPTWVDWTPYDQEAVGHLTLFNDKGPLLNSEQVQKALGWDGSSFSSLASGDWSDKEFLFVMKENEWEGNVTIKMDWVDAHDASPTRGLQTLDPAALKELDAKYSTHMRQAPKAAPAKAPAKAATPPGKSVVAAGVSVKPGTTTTTAKPPSTKAMVIPTKISAKAATTGETDQNSAWASVTAVKGKVSDDTLATLWIDACEEVAPGKLEDAITAAQWAKVRDAVLSKFSVTA
jgi:hypothetical protein